MHDALHRKRHAEGHKYDGINAKKGSICNMYVCTAAVTEHNSASALNSRIPRCAFALVQDGVLRVCIFVCAYISCDSSRTVTS